MKKAFSLIELSIVILIIGILIAGVTQGSRLVAQIRLQSARAQSESSPVASIKDLTLWFDATSEKAFDDADVEEAHTITNWYTTNPRSTTKITVTQATAGNKPLYYSDKLSQLPSAYFDGSNDCLVASNVQARDVVQDQQATIFTVQYFVGTTLADNTSIFWFSLGAANGYVGHRFHLNAPSSPNLLIFDSGYSDSSGRITYSIPSLSTISKPIVISAFRNNANADVRINGSSVVSSSSLSSGVTAGNSVMGVGCIPPEIDTAYTFHGYIGEIIVFDRALKTEERQSVEQYLGKKWGIKIN
jgi:prepilin-type N-terminal cleavage/methylation domain-containing protein